MGEKFVVYKIMVNNNQFSTWQFGTDHKKNHLLKKRYYVPYMTTYTPSQNSTLVVKVGE